MHPRVHDLFLCHTQALTGQIMQLVACNALHGAEARFCRWLLMFRERAAGEVLPSTDEYLSEMLSVQRPTVTLIARTLQAAGLIRYRRPCWRRAASAMVPSAPITKGCSRTALPVLFTNGQTGSVRRGKAAAAGWPLGI
jgi:hypothetical protein